MKPQVCKIKGCGREISFGAARGWCRAHYQRWKRNGNTYPQLPIRSHAGRFNPKVPSLLQRTGATYRQLNYWASQGWIPSLETSPGSGRPRNYSPEQEHKITLLARASKLTLLEVADLLERLNQLQEQGAA